MSLAPLKTSTPVAFTTSDGTRLNCEHFGSSHGPLLVHIHGVCESAETLTVQRLAGAATDDWNLHVLELEGHGLSVGPRAVCPSFDRLVSHVIEFVDAQTANQGAARKPWAICGHSLGGTVAA